MDQLSTIGVEAVAVPISQGPNAAPAMSLMLATRRLAGVMLAIRDAAIGLALPPREASRGLGRVLAITYIPDGGRKPLRPEDRLLEIGRILVAQTAPFPLGAALTSGVVASAVMRAPGTPPPVVLTSAWWASQLGPAAAALSYILSEPVAYFTAETHDTWRVLSVVVLNVSATRENAFASAASYAVGSLLAEQAMYKAAATHPAAPEPMGVLPRFFVVGLDVQQPERRRWVMLTAFESREERDAFFAAPAIDRIFPQSTVDVFRMHQLSSVDTSFSFDRVMHVDDDDDDDQ
jgi:hypothetical protein